MFNVDRWEAYTRQNYSRSWRGNYVMSPYQLNSSEQGWSNCTPKQIRRMKKKANKGDTSIGVLSVTTPDGIHINRSNVCGWCEMPGHGSSECKEK